MKKPSLPSVLAMVLLIAAVMVFITSTWAESQSRSRLREMDADVMKLQQQIDDRLAESDLPNIEVIEEKLVSCADIGNKIADIQNDIIYRTNMSVADYGKAIKEKLEPLKNYIDNSNLVALNYWYAPTEPGIVSYKWTFETGYRFHTIQSDGTRSEPTVPVLWVCREVNADGSEGPILMYVRGTMDFDANMITIPENGIGVKSMTLRGHRYLMGEPTDGADEVDDSVQWQPPVDHENTPWIDENGVIQTNPVESPDVTEEAA